MSDDRLAEFAREEQSRQHAIAAFDEHLDEIDATIKSQKKRIDKVRR